MAVVHGKEGACTSDHSATEVASDGSVKWIDFVRPVNPAFDCFCVYPTASEDPTPYSDMIPGQEVGVTTAQFGRDGGAVCRQLAPLYRSSRSPRCARAMTATRCSPATRGTSTTMMRWTRGSPT